MRCLITMEETDSKVNGRFPLSIQARPLLTKIVERHNEKIFEQYKARVTELNNGVETPDTILRQLAPKVSKGKVLRLLQMEEQDILDTKDEVLENV